MLVDSSCSQNSLYNPLTYTKRRQAADSMFSDIPILMVIIRKLAMILFIIKDIDTFISVYIKKIYIIFYMITLFHFENSDILGV